MTRTNANQKVAAAATIAQDRAREVAAKVKPAAAQVKPLAKTTQEAARRGIVRTRTWAAPQIERTGQALQDNVAPKVADVLSSAARRIEPDKPAQQELVDAVRHRGTRRGRRHRGSGCPAQAQQGGEHGAGRRGGRHRGGGGPRDAPAQRQR